MWIKIITPFEWRPTINQIYSYKVGYSYNVTKSCAEQAIKARAAKAIKAPSRQQKHSINKIVDQ
ncbi:hypothetical protein [Bartonella tamiae]|uniref:Uncharacterized protein n=1 Tax=Bartonella tamiae Th239 TaxID=1094558 RepID=J0R7G5_9HYPH|nr:hypothetical protein [Bartonella tamiae]EJF91679.1 hypothetical protein ME5_00058 [Bartonella tamiae Th239]